MYKIEGWQLEEIRSRFVVCLWRGPGGVSQSVGQGHRMLLFLIGVLQDWSGVQARGKEGIIHSL